MQNKTAFLFLIVFYTSCTFTMETNTDFYNDFCLGIFNFRTIHKEKLDDRGDEARREHDAELNEYVRTQREEQRAKQQQILEQRRLSEAQEINFQLQQRMKDKTKRKARKKRKKGKNYARNRST